MLKKLTYWFLSFIELQLVITLLSLPILIHWGLAISYMSPLGNLLFTPLLSLFLWISSLFSFLKLSNLPGNWFITILDWITIIWNYLLSLAKPTWLIGFSHGMIWPAIGIALFIFIFYTVTNPSKKTALIILTSCCFLLITIKYLSQKNRIFQVSNLPLYVLQLNNTTYLLDGGALGSKQNFYAWIDYTILPELVKIAGITIIDTLVLYKPNKRLAKITQQLAKQTNIKTVLVTTKQKCYYNMKNILQDKNIKVYPIFSKKQKKLP